MKTRKHVHEWVRSKSTATVDICYCGQFRHNENNKNPVIIEVPIRPQHTPTLVLLLQIIDNGAGVKYLCDSSNGIGAGRELATMTHHADGVHNADLKIEDELNAAFIVRAVNSHEELLEALKRWRKLFEYDAAVVSHSLYILTTQLIAKAEGK